MPVVSKTDLTMADYTTSVRNRQHRSGAGLPEAIVHPKLEQLQRRDEAKLALLRHVEVIYEGNEVLASGWPKHALQCNRSSAQRHIWMVAGSQVCNWQANSQLHSASSMSPVQVFWLDKLSALTVAKVGQRLPRDIANGHDDRVQHATDLCRQQT